MIAGTGITHIEFNHSKVELIRFLQIWILPDTDEVTPSYEQTYFPDDEKSGTLRLIASADGRERSVTIHQDANLYATLLEAGEEILHLIPSGRHVWIQVARGKVLVNGEHLAHGDGLAVTGKSQLIICGDGQAELLLFDLA